MNCDSISNTLSLIKLGQDPFPGLPVSIDNFEKVSIVSFLSHFHADHYKEIERFYHGKRIYCSEVTKKLAELRFPFLCKNLVGIPLNLPTFISIVDDDDAPTQESKEGSPLKLIVTLYESNHCPGSVMFHFEFPKLDFPPTATESQFIIKRKLPCHSLLYTGDFRFEDKFLERQDILEMFEQLKEKKIEKCYVDSTFWDPIYQGIPSRWDAFVEINQIIHQRIHSLKSNQEKFKRIGDFSTIKRTLRVFLNCETLGAEILVYWIHQEFPQLKFQVDEKKFSPHRLKELRNLDVIQNLVVFFDSSKSLLSKTEASDLINYNLKEGHNDDVNIQFTLTSKAGIDDVASCISNSNSSNSNDDILLFRASAQWRKMDYMNVYNTMPLKSSNFSSNSLDNKDSYDEDNGASDFDEHNKMDFEEDEIWPGTYQQDSDKILTWDKAIRRRGNVYYVMFSMHASVDEVRKFVQLIKPNTVFSIANGNIRKNQELKILKELNQMVISSPITDLKLLAKSSSDCHQQVKYHKDSVMSKDFFVLGSKKRIQNVMIHNKIDNNDGCLKTSSRYYGNVINKNNNLDDENVVSTWIDLESEKYFKKMKYFN